MSVNRREFSALVNKLSKCPALLCARTTAVIIVKERRREEGITEEIYVEQTDYRLITKERRKGRTTREWKTTRNFDEFSVWRKRTIKLLLRTTCVFCRFWCFDTLCCRIIWCWAGIVSDNVILASTIADDYCSVKWPFSQDVMSLGHALCCVVCVCDDL